MTRRRRAAVLLGLALVLGTLSATHVARREAALRGAARPAHRSRGRAPRLPAGRDAAADRSRCALAAGPLRAAGRAGVRRRARRAAARRAGRGRRGGERGVARAPRATPEPRSSAASARSTSSRAAQAVGAARAWTCSSTTERADAAGAGGRRGARRARPRCRPSEAARGLRACATLRVTASGRRVPRGGAVVRARTCGCSRGRPGMTGAWGSSSSAKGSDRANGASKGSVARGVGESRMGHLSPPPRTPSMLPFAGLASAHGHRGHRRGDRASARARRRGHRKILGIAGPPGGGKSTVARAVVAELGDQARLVPMDGFHLAQAELVRLGRRDRMGAPDTFDAAGYAALLQRLRVRRAGRLRARVPARDRGADRGRDRRAQRPSRWS